MKNKWKGLIIVTLFISVTALCLTLFRITPITYDWMAVIVSTLSMLTTILIGWQVFSLFNLTKIKDDFKKDKDFILKGQIEIKIGMNQTMFEYMVKEGYKPGIYKYGMYLLIQLTQTGNYDNASAYVAYLINEAKDGLEMPYFEKSSLLNDLYSCKNLDKVQNIDKLERVLINIKVTESGNNESFLKYRDKEFNI